MHFGRIARDLHEAALSEQLKPAIGRDEELNRLIELMSKDVARPILLTGPPGAGKTALIGTVAAHTAVESLPFRLFEVDPAALKADTVMVREHFNNLMTRFHEDPQVWLVIDQMSVLLAEPTLQGAQELLLNDVKSGNRRVLYTLRSGLCRRLRPEYRGLVENVERIELKPLSPEITGAILREIKPTLEVESTTLISDEAIHESVLLAHQYLPDQALPGSAIELLSRASRRHRKKTDLDGTPTPWMDKSTMKRLEKAVGAHDIRRAAGDMTGHDVVALENDVWKANLTANLRKSFEGDQGTVARIAATVAMIRQDMGKRGRSAAVVIFSGPPGCGKTQVSELLARSLPGNPDAAYLIDLGKLQSPEELLRVPQGRPAKPSPRPLAVVVLKGLNQAPEDVRLRLGKILCQPEPHRAFQWGEAYPRSLFVVTCDSPHASVMESDILAEAESLMGLGSGRLVASGVSLPPLEKSQGHTGKVPAENLADTRF